VFHVISTSDDKLRRHNLVSEIIVGFTGGQCMFCLSLFWSGHTTPYRLSFAVVMNVLASRDNNCGFHAGQAQMFGCHEEGLMSRDHHQ